MPDPTLEKNARAYAALFGLEADFETPLGYGNDGTVWKTERRTAIKAFDRKRKYELELACYQRFASEDVVHIGEFAVPALIAHDADLMIVEMTLVSPPYVIDFAKVWLDKAPDFPDDSIAERLAQAEEDFGADWPAVCGLLWTLKTRFGIPESGQHQAERRWPIASRSASSGPLAAPKRVGQRRAGAWCKPCFPSSSWRSGCWPPS